MLKTVVNMLFDIDLVYGITSDSIIHTNKYIYIHKHIHNYGNMFFFTYY